MTTVRRMPSSPPRPDLLREVLVHALRRQDPEEGAWMNARPGIVLLARWIKPVVAFGEVRQEGRMRHYEPCGQNIHLVPVRGGVPPDVRRTVAFPVEEN